MTPWRAGVRGDLSKADRRRKFAGHSLRARLAKSANAGEYQVQQQLGHASVTMTRRYQRKRERFRRRWAISVAICDKQASAHYRLRRGMNAVTIGPRGTGRAGHPSDVAL